MRPAARMLLVLFSILALAPAAWATEPNPKQETTFANFYNIDVSVPESPAFAILGVTPQSVVRPSTTKDLAASLLNGVDRNGNLQTGLALDFSFYPLIAGDKISLDDYKENSNGFNMTRFLWRMQTSIATAKGTSTDDKSVRLALGLRLTPWDLGDPRLDKALGDCLTKAAMPLVLRPIDPESADKETERLKRRDALRTATKACRDDADGRLWNDSSFSLGAAPSWISKDSSTDHLKWNGAGAWASLGYGFENVKGLEDTAQLILHARYHVDENVPDAKVKGQFIKQDSAAVGGRLRILMAERFNLSLEGLWIHETPVRHPVSDSTRVSIGVEYKMASGLWLEFAVGGEGGRRDGNNQAFALGTVKWGTSKEPALTR